MKIATNSISSSVFLGDNRVLQLSGSMTRRSTEISDIPLTIQQLHINASINDVLVQTHLSFIAASSSLVSPLPTSSVMALTEHSGGGGVSLVNDTDGSTLWSLPTSNRYLPCCIYGMSLLSLLLIHFAQTSSSFLHRL
jgi:hypothetical protein